MAAKKKKKPAAQARRKKPIPPKKGQKARRSGRKNKQTERTPDAPVLPPLPQTAPLSAHQKWLIPLVLMLFAVLLYSGSIHHQFAYDDMAVLVENKFIQKGFAGIPELLTTQYFAGYDPNTNAMAYRPVSMVLYAIEYQFFGANPMIFHLGNILFYALTALFLFYALRRILNGYSIWLAVGISLLFIAHPIHVDVVANIKSRDELLGFLNLCISLTFLFKYLENRKKLQLGLSLLFYFLALASKETLITTIVVIPMLLYFFRDLTLRQVLRATLPFLAVWIVFLLIRQGIVGSDHGFSQIRYIDNPLMAAKGEGQLIASIIMVLGMYLKGLVFPLDLASDYSYNSIPLVDWTHWGVYAWLLVYLGLIAIAIMGLKRKSPYSFIIGYYLATFSITSNIFILSSNAYADRFLYTPSLAICMAIGFLIYQFLANERVKKGEGNLKDFALPGACLLVVLTLYSIRTVQHVPIWKDNFTLYQYHVEKLPENARMLKNMGGELSRKAVAAQIERDNETMREYASQAIPYLEKALEIYERQNVGHVHLGNCYLMLSDYPNAERALRRALDIYPGQTYAISSLANVYYRQQKYQESINLLEGMNQRYLKSNDYYVLSLCYSRLGNSERADYYRKLSGR